MCTQASLVRWTMCIRAGICSNYALCDDAMDIDDVVVQYYVLFACFVLVYYNLREIALLVCCLAMCQLAKSCPSQLCWKCYIIAFGLQTSLTVHILWIYADRCNY